MDALANFPGGLPVRPTSSDIPSSSRTTPSQLAAGNTASPVAGCFEIVARARQEEAGAKWASEIGRSYRPFVSAEHGKQALEQARKLARRGCDLGLSDLCTLAADELVEKEVRAACTLYRRACELDDREACGRAVSACQTSVTVAEIARFVSVAPLGDSALALAETATTARRQALVALKSQTASLTDVPIADPPWERVVASAHSQGVAVVNAQRVALRTPDGTWKDLVISAPEPYPQLLDAQMLDSGTVLLHRTYGCNREVSA